MWWKYYCIKWAAVILIYCLFNSFLLILFNFHFILFELNKDGYLFWDKNSLSNFLDYTFIYL